MQEHIHLVFIMLSASSDFLPTLIYLSLFFTGWWQGKLPALLFLFFMFNLIGDWFSLLYVQCVIFQCPSDRSPAVEGCDCPSGKPGLPGLPGPMVRHVFKLCILMYWQAYLLGSFACLAHLIKTHILIVWMQGFRGEKGREGPPGPDGKPVSTAELLVVFIIRFGYV